MEKLVIATLLIVLSLGSAPVSSFAGQGDAVEVTYWNSIKNSDDPDEFELYLKRYPKGEFAALARIRITRLKNEKSEVKNDSANARPQPRAKPRELSPAEQAEKLLTGSGMPIITSATIITR